MSERPRPTPEQLQRYADEFNQSQTLKFFGVKVSFPKAEHVCVDLEVRPEHRGGLGTQAVNGGILAAMFDLVLGCSPALVDPTKRTATMQLSMSFMRPVTGERIRAEARIDSAGASTLFASALILDESGTVCARASGVMKLGKVPWASGGSPAVS